MLKKYLPNDMYQSIIDKFCFDNINEIRLRLNAPIVVCCNGRNFLLKNFEKCSKTLINEIVYRLCKSSMYIVNDSLKNGFITIENGIRIGICGEIVSEKGFITTIKNFQSLNIRIPHLVKNCSLPVYSYLVDEQVKNTLVISAPGMGKTTFIRDLISQICMFKPDCNILVADERGEIAFQNDNVSVLGDFVDVYSYCTKEFAFKNGIRSMSPNVFVTDEIDIEKDFDVIKSAITSGVKIIATMHCSSMFELKTKSEQQKLKLEELFERFVVLNSSNGVGTIAYVFDNKDKCLYCKL